jgi:hypothetical protein
MGSFAFSLLDALVSVGLPHARARQVAEQFDRSVDERVAQHYPELATSRALADLATKSDLVQFATKRELAELETRLVERITEVEVHLGERITEVQAGLGERITEVETRLGDKVADLQARFGERLARFGADTQARIAETKVELVRWMLAALTAQTLLLLGAMKLL